MATPTEKSSRKRARRHLSIVEVCEDLGITRSTFYDWRAKRTAPPCLKLPNGEIRVRTDDYETWLTSRMERVA